MTKDHVMEIFGNFGNVIFCDFPMDKQKSWINTSMAYVEFEKLEEADECVKKMNGGMSHHLAKILCVKNVGGFVVCGSLIK